MTHEESIIEVVRKTLPSVVSIIISKTLEEIVAENPLNQYFGTGPYGNYQPTPEEQQEFYQSLPRTDGFILTNKHVVMDKEAEYTVLTETNDKYKAHVVARDPINDVAILKIDSDCKPGENCIEPLNLGDSNKIVLGQTVIAIGTALGEFQNTVSSGIVSGLSRFITAVTDMTGHQERLRGLIQTDAAINPGNSGGPLVNLKGQVIGINSAVVFGAQNIGFAIPINRAKADLEDLKKFGKIRKPFLGVRYILLNKNLQEKFKLPRETGALILREHGPDGHGIVPGSPAHQAGLKEFDIITECKDSTINEKNTLEDILDTVKIGDEVSIKILRSGKEYSKKLHIGER
ncbi:MAG: Protease Do [Parcubacteria group bacterium GW2011_GWA2_47_10]|nr:MAG: Protease Do [Parcubacteria group bacterium GW2011_GWA2_47_10]